MFLLFNLVPFLLCLVIFLGVFHIWKFLSQGWKEPISSYNFGDFFVVFIVLPFDSLNFRMSNHSNRRKASFQSRPSLTSKNSISGRSENTLPTSHFTFARAPPNDQMMKALAPLKEEPKLDLLDAKSDATYVLLTPFSPYIVLWVGKKWPQVNIFEFSTLTLPGHSIVATDLRTSPLCMVFRCFWHRHRLPQNRRISGFASRREFLWIRW